MAGYRLMPSINRILVAAQGFRYRFMSIDILYDELMGNNYEKKKKITQL